jgi:mono/diheme cytochrome c family protein
MCAGCHGANGQGGAGGPSLQVSTKSTSQLQSIIANGSGGMPGYSGSLSSSEISGLASFTKAMQSSGATTSAPPAGGADLYSSKCAGCHGSSGGGGSGPSLQTSTLSSSAINTIVANGSGGMPGYSGSLDSDQISAVSSYTAGLQDSDATTTTLDPASGGAAAYASQCAGCHGANGEGGFGPSLQTLDLSVTEMESVIADGYGGMAGFSESLTPQQINELAAFSLTFQASGSGDDGEGSALYTANCAACHGVSGEGGIGPALAGTALTSDEIASIVRTGSEDMHSLTSSLSPEEVETVAEYIVTLDEVSDDPGDPAVTDETAELYSTMCAGCHGAGGEGASAPALVGTSLDTAGLIVVITDGKNGMPGYADQLSSTQIEDMAVLIVAMGQGHGDAGDAGDAPTTTRAVVTSSPEPSDDDEGDGTAARTLGIILLALVLGSGTYLAFASRATRER